MSGRRQWRDRPLDSRPRVLKTPKPGMHGFRWSKMRGETGIVTYGLFLGTGCTAVEHALCLGEAVPRDQCARFLRTARRIARAEFELRSADITARPIPIDVHNIGASAA